MILTYFGYFGSHFEVVTCFILSYDYNLMNMTQWNHYIKKKLVPTCMYLDYKVTFHELSSYCYY